MKDPQSAFSRSTRALVMIKAGWEAAGSGEMDDPEWSIPRDRRAVRTPLARFCYEDVFSVAPYDTPFRLMNTSRGSDWVGPSGHKLERYEELRKDRHHWLRRSKLLSKLLRHTAARRDRNVMIPCDVGGWFKITHILRISEHRFGVVR